MYSEIFIPRLTELSLELQILPWSIHYKLNFALIFFDFSNVSHVWKVSELPEGKDISYNFPVVLQDREGTKKKDETDFVVDWHLFTNFLLKHTNINWIMS